ncbi:MAG: asparagine synthase C-terminal domain-containing protein [Candidatus Bathyarchaeota archaeon]|nr:asparagine synthase C-terminal domain-containing protein [Candidatus Termiticorpusculum sp.]MCL1970635.1 asparagine synthase C-terminal domain-containing protein [Candidatus Termiticorpusculum sp.]
MSLDIKEYIHLIPEARTVVNRVIENNLGDGMLFSAGTDTSIIAYEAIKYRPDISTLTIAFKQGDPKDTVYVREMVEFLKLKHQTYSFDVAEALENVPKVVKALKTFDPMDVRNSISIYIGLLRLKEHGLSKILTGDGLDELFGYPWQFHLSEEEFCKKQVDMWAEMGFSSITLSKSLGMEVKQPYLDPVFMNWAKKLPVKVKINMHNGEKYSKWLLRKAYEETIPREVVWRPKAPLEAGTGTSALTSVFQNQYTDTEFMEKQKGILEADNVQIRDKEQLLYYEAFREIFDKPSEVFTDSKDDAKMCPQCKGHVKTKIQFCKICGAYPI